MAQHNGSVDSLPTSSSAGSDTGYFADSKYSTPGTTPATTPGVTVSHLENPLPPTSSSAIASSVMPALARDFPKPAVDIDVKEALERQPGRWTIKGQMEANQKRIQQLQADDVAAAAKEKRAREFEATKRDLLASHGNLISPSS
ncbi:hypothetical protein S40285_07848 [Stachybotrys chlorohalonatus IBT 40285]|uniref:Uncharacterized protein n=1 Tax=Stachybotrys chlorohalonatus (strain IBT 40285) TaxID=1283841 RepID=A0A084QFC6_STAC4|nr:hypothetical protein S40285_07848 [Stachybotrys chlorohalonata IBT 40285]